MHACIQGSRLDGSTHAHMHIHMFLCTYMDAVMISSSLGRCTSAAQRGGNITFLFLKRKYGYCVFVYAVRFICCHTVLHLFHIMSNLATNLI